MKKCPFCAEDVQDAAIVCKHCGRDLKTGAGAAPPPTKPKTSVVSVLGGLLFALFFIGWCASKFTPEPSPTTPPTTRTSSAAAPTSASAPTGDVLALLSSRGYQSESGSFWYVEGQVKNISNSPLRGVMATSTWYTKTNEFVKADQAMIEFDPLMPGQTSTFKTISRGNPSMSNYTVEFSRIMGGKLATRDNRKGK